MLSVLADLPFAQSPAVVGSVDRHDWIQATAGANEKIEGLFDLCAARRPGWAQGVLMPESNRRHPMLHRRVRQTVAEGRFQIHAVGHVHHGVEFFTGSPAMTSFRSAYRAG